MVSKEVLESVEVDVHNPEYQGRIFFSDPSTQTYFGTVPHINYHLYSNFHTSISKGWFNDVIT